MKKYDISLDSGLSYLSGNMTRFCALAKIFSDGYEHNRERLENMFDGGSDRLIFEIHSLKSAAKGIGAISLFEIAKTMEDHLASGDFDYAEHARELLMFIWKRTAAGMKLLVSETADNIHFVSAEQISCKSLEMQIQKGLEEHVWLETQNALQQLINKETDAEAIRNLTYISEFVDELDFVSAETLFSQFLERRKANVR